MKLRDKLQSDCVDAIKHNSGHGIIDVAPRFGKSKVVIDYLQVYNEHFLSIDKVDVLITVPRNPIIKSWEKELEVWWPTFKEILNVKIINQRSIEKEDLHLYDHIILDEIHTLSDRQLDYIQGNRDVKSSMLGLSGSINPQTKKKLKEILDLDVIYKYSIEDAIKDGIISNYQITVIQCELDDEDAYIVAGGKKKFKTTEKKNYDYLCKMFDKFKRMSYYKSGLNNVKLKYAGERANLLYRAKTKVRACKELVDTLERCLIFAARTETADILGEKSYHSKTVEDNLSKFISGEINKLAVCEMIDMGVTIPNLKIGVFHQLKSNNESAIQKVLRMCNLEGGEIAQIFIFMFVDTQDEKWVSNALGMFDQNKIKIVEYAKQADKKNIE